MIVIFLLFIGVRRCSRVEQRLADELSRQPLHRSPFSAGRCRPVGCRRSTRSSSSSFAPIAGLARLGRESDPSIPLGKLAWASPFWAPVFLFLAWGSTFLAREVTQLGLRRKIITYLLRHTAKLACRRWAFERDQAVAAAFRRPDDGYLVPRLLARQPDRRPGRRAVRGDLDGRAFGLKALMVIVAGGCFLIFTPLTGSQIGPLQTLAG